MSKHQRELDNLSRFLPFGSEHQILDLIQKYKVHFSVSKPRKTKLGDYRPPVRYTNHRITVNGDLSPIQFLITTVHEFAHLLVWIEHKNKVKPHGKEWKQQYYELFSSILDELDMDKSTEHMLRDHIIRPRASSSADLKLNKRLINLENDTAMRVEDIPLNTPFILGNKTLIKSKKLRTRYLCLDSKTNKKYSVHPLAEIQMPEK